jgi:hypothetical protein
MPLKKKKPISSINSHERIGNVCANCGLKLQAEDRFCPHCGQKDHDLNVGVSHLLGEAIEGFLHLDSKSLQTVWKLIFSPGFLTIEFIKGRRVGYVAPVRLYIFISFIFFLLLSLPDGKHITTKDEEPTISFYEINSSELRGLSQMQIDSVMKKHDLKPTMFNKYIVRQLVRIGSGGSEEFSHVFIKAISYMMFALMPVFALFVYLLHRKKELRYIGTLILSVHFHCFIFSVLVFCMLMNRFTGIYELLFVIPVVFTIYLFMAFRNVYGDSKLVTLFKMLLIGLLQTVSIIILFIATIFMSLMLF